jgi:hypothetical protein
MSMAGTPAGASPLPYRPHGLGVASYETYLEAQTAVDHLADQGFPVETVAIVGTDLRLVEQVTGRLTRGRALAAGAMSGAWFGGFVGLLLGLFATDGTFASWLQVVLTGVAIGALWGFVLGWFGYRATGGRRDFLSRSGVVAERYEVVVRGQGIEQARQLLGRFETEGGPRRLAGVGGAPGHGVPGGGSPGGGSPGHDVPGHDAPGDITPTVAEQVLGQGRGPGTS